MSGLDEKIQALIHGYLDELGVVANDEDLKDLTEALEELCEWLGHEPTALARLRRRHRQQRETPIDDTGPTETP